MAMRLYSALPDFSRAGDWLNRDGAAEPARRIGAPLLVHFWAADCELSKEAMPRVRRWRDAYGLAVVGVCAPRDGEAPGGFAAAAKAAADAWGIAHPVAIDAERALARAFGNACTPAYYLFDEAGLLRHAHTGGQGLGLLEQRIRKLVGTKPL
ncbi:redoxin family protein [Paenibacillus sp.]|uniref:redoxin family protein n=1 Tax=Paenibacillus sp. TaxID=58172 RepID=UPI002D6491A0|nr:redoxin family protein [Paenibacillus sp.]HZG83906.1 redoxin family protein [Paenibacillus sp.]